MSSHFNGNGDPKNRYRTEQLAIDACNRRGWYRHYACKICKGWHISRSKLIRYDSVFMDNWRRNRPYFDMELEMGRRVAYNQKMWDEDQPRALKSMKDTIRRKHGYPDALRPRLKGGPGGASVQEVELPTSDVNTVARGVSPRK